MVQEGWTHPRFGDCDIKIGGSSAWSRTALSCLSSPPPVILPFYAGCPLELLFFDVCAWILTSAYFDILHFQQLWPNHLQAVPGFILQVTGCLPKVCFLIRYAKPFKTFSFLVFLTVWSSAFWDMASESGCHFGTTPSPPTWGLICLSLKKKNWMYTASFLFVINSWLIFVIPTLTKLCQ